MGSAAPNTAVASICGVNPKKTFIKFAIYGRKATIGSTSHPALAYTPKLINMVFWILKHSENRGLKGSPNVAFVGRAESAFGFCSFGHFHIIRFQ